MRIVFAVFLFVHGFAHGVGFLTVAGIVEDETSEGHAFLLDGREPGDPIMWVFAVVWLACLAGLVAAGIGVLREASWALPVLIGATAVSTILGLMWVRQARSGSWPTSP